ncbi:hypothetical protein [Cyclobacterium plantarum]|uniref:Uncharacterized protein n=1 Tax=Cyclobacterium plantarum TaxID=2716263 RepID=A0ABX0HBH7_9BACT|nr:hypothetical protein [Cyclobacterium plantarum]NHE58992.1 hypothetical protein [Cyclobacterium plantarum]
MDYKQADNATIVGLYGVGKDNYVSRLTNQMELRFQKLDFGSGLASGSFNGRLLPFSGASNQSSDTFEIEFENIELVIVEE